MCSQHVVGAGKAASSYVHKLLIDPNLDLVWRLSCEAGRIWKHVEGPLLDVTICPTTVTQFGNIGLSHPSSRSITSYDAARDDITASSLDLSSGELWTGGYQF